MINPYSYYMVQGWMLTELQLKGNALAVYAIIYGFSQDNNGEYTGSAKYLSEWLGCSKKTVLSTLASLTELGHLSKKTTSRNGVTFCSYTANVPPQIVIVPSGEVATPPGKNFPQGGEKTSPGVGKNFPQGGEKTSPGVGKNFPQGGEKITPNNTRDNTRKILLEDKESNSEAPPPPSPTTKKKKSVKHKHGEYENVLLTDGELDKLKEEYSDWAARIERLSSYIASTGKSYKSHYATIRNWARRDQETGRTPTRQEAVPGWCQDEITHGQNGLKKLHEELRTAANDESVRARAEALRKQLEV